MNAQNLSVCIEFVTNDGIQLIGLSNINESLSTHHIVYKIHNLENSKHYIGQHTTDNPFDLYMGSGKLIQRSLSIHPLSAFVKEILFDFETFEQMNQKEQELVPLSACYPNDPMSYNLKEGGSYGQHNEQSRQQISLKQKTRYANMTQEEHDNMCKIHKDIWKHKTPKELHAHGLKVKLYWDNAPQEVKDAFSKKIHDITVGENNPMYGRKIKDCMSSEKYEQWRKNSVEANRRIAQRPEWHKKMSEVTSGEKNPMYGHSCTEYMSDEKIDKWKSNLSKASSGKNNPMYGKSSWEKCTPEQRADRSRRFSQSMKGKNKGKRCMKLPDETKYKFVNACDVQKYLDMGYEFYSRNKGKTFKKNKRI